MHENMREIRTAVREVRETNLQVYQMVLEMQTTLPSQVKRQQSVYFLDAWGRFSPFHLEFINSWDAFLAVLKVRFKHCGLGKIEKNQYVLEEANSKRPIDIRRPWETCFLPGQHVNMDMCFEERGTSKNSCPVCQLFESARIDEAIDW